MHIKPEIMSEYLKKITDKFFNDKCTADEAEKVLNWLETPEGKKYLDENISKEAGKIDEAQDLHTEISLSTEFDSDLIFIKIIEKLKSRGFWGFSEKRGIPKLFYMAASVLIIVSATIFYIANPFGGAESQTQLIVLKTSDSEQREIKLNDGTRIVMNSQSTLRINEDYQADARIVELEGEAFFEVVSMPERPFIIEMNKSTVEVIGTAFNIRNIEETNSIEVSVTEGIVAFSGNNESGDSKVTLKRGDYANWNNTSGEMLVEQFGVQNYLAWLSNEFDFNEMSLQQVCVQLSRFYKIECKFAENSIENHQLTAQFKVADLKNTLSVIGLSLNLDYHLEENVVVWRKH